MRTTAKSLFLTAILFAPAVHLGAQATRTWVSGAGSDKNPCTRTAPCQTFGAAIGQTAAGGEIVVLDSGDFGPVTITKGITISATGVDAGIAATNYFAGIVIAAGANDTVSLRGLHIYDGCNLCGDNSLGGIIFQSGARLSIENCRITGAGYGILIESASTTFITNTLVINNAGFGISVQPRVGGSANVALDHVQVVNSGTGVAAAALDPSTAAVVEVTNSELSHNSLGVSADGQVVVSLESTVIDSNGFGLILTGGAIARLSNVNVWRNQKGFDTTRGVLNSFGNNHTTGNLDGVQPTVNHYLSPL